jgi:glutaminyl-tRNA synthetase
MGTRQIPFGSELYIDRHDFAEVPPKGFKRLAPGGEVRLRNAYVIRCDEVIRADNGDIVELRCTVDLDTLGKNPVARKVKGVIHWVCASAGIRAEIRLYDRLLIQPQLGSVDMDLKSVLNPDSLRTLTGCIVEPSLASATPQSLFQFEREGYFVADMDSRPDALVFNRTVTLRDTWAKRSG